MVPIDASSAAAVRAGWEEIACPLCAAVEEERVIEVPAAEGVHRVVRCRRCGMSYLNPRPDVHTIGRYYSADYEEYQAPERPRSNPWHRLREKLERLVLAHEYGHPPPLTRWYEKALAGVCAAWCRPRADSMTGILYHGEGRLLDVGCGSGWYAHRMRQRGWKATGLDFSAHAARQVARRFGIPTLVGSLPHPEIRDESFDVITMGCVLEHVHHPHAIIHGAAQALRPGGWLVIVVPNLDSWGFRFFGADWWPLELPRHLLHFTPATLRRLVEAHGLQVCEVKMLLRGGWMRRSLAMLRQRQDLPPARRLLARLGRWRPVSSLVSRWTYWTRQADCIMLLARRPGAARPSPFVAGRPSQAA
jgi:SAM-dependent methyltransferase